MSNVKATNTAYGTLGLCYKHEHIRRVKQASRYKPLALFLDTTLYINVRTFKLEFASVCE